MAFSPSAIGIHLGVDLGKLQDYTAFAVAEVCRDEEGESYVLRHLERMPLGTNYQDVSARMTAIYERLCDAVEEANKGRQEPIAPPWQYIDVTGVGGAFFDFHMGVYERRDREWRERRVAWIEAVRAWELLPTLTRRETPKPEFTERRPWVPHVTAVTITSGDKDTEMHEPEGYEVLHVGKEALVARLNVLLGVGNLGITEADGCEGRMLLQQAKSYEMKRLKSQHSSYNAREGEHDDLVIAAALAVWERAWRQSERLGVFA